MHQNFLYSICLFNFGSYLGFLVSSWSFVSPLSIIVCFCYFCAFLEASFSSFYLPGAKFIFSVQESLINNYLTCVQGIEKFKTDLNTLHPILAECRVFKSDLELALIHHANDISSEAHIEVTNCQCVLFPKQAPAY